MYCHLRFFHSRETSSSVTVYTFLGVFSVLLAIFTVFGNSLILHSLRKCQTLHPPTKALLSSLALSDLGVAVVDNPLCAAHYFSAVFNNIEVFCAVRGPYIFAAYFLGSVSFLTMTAISLDRYYAFKLRLRYRQFVTFKRVVFVLAACWTFGFIWPLSWLINDNISRIMAAVILVSCIVITSISYIKISHEIRRHQHQIQDQQTIPASQKHGENHFSLGQYKKSLNTVILVFCLLIACYIPYFPALLMAITNDSSSTAMMAVDITASLIKLNSLLNPIVYCWKIRAIRREVINALPCFAS